MVAHLRKVQTLCRRGIGLVLVLWATGFLAPHAQGQTKLPQFEVASIRPSKPGNESAVLRPTLDGIRATNCTLLNFAAFAYGPTEQQLGNHGFSGAPKWADSDRYDLLAKVSDADAESLRKLGPDERAHTLSQMLRALLADRFQLAVHKESRELLSYDLVIAKGGLKAKPGKPDDPTLPNGVLRMTNGSITGTGVSMERLAGALGAQVKHPIADATGLKEKYTFTLEWQPEEEANPEAAGGSSQPAAQLSGPSIFTALQEQLGLKLESKKGYADVIVVDHVERPTQN